MKREQKTLGQGWVMLVVIIGVLSGTTASLFIRYGTAPSLVLAAYRMTFATLILLPLVLLHHWEELRRLDRATVLWSLLAGALMGLMLVAYIMSVKYTTIAAASVLTGTEILFVAAFMYLSGKERYNALGKTGILIALIGSILVSLSGDHNPAVNAPLGNAAGIACAALLAAYSVVSSKIRQANLSTIPFTFIVYGVAAVMLNLLIPFTGCPYFGYGKINLLVGFGMAVFCSLLSHSLYTWSLKYISPTLLSFFEISAPIPTVLLGFVVLGEIPLWNQVVGGIAVIIGIFLYTVRDPVKQ